MVLSPALGAEIEVGVGGDPWLELDPTGNVHVVYVNGPDVMYRRIDLPSGHAQPAIKLGTGTDPHVDVGRDGNPAVAWAVHFSKVKFTHWRDGGFAPESVLVSEASAERRVRRPRVSIGRGGKVWLMFEHANKAIVTPLTLGEPPAVEELVELGEGYNAGGMDQQPEDRLHVIWRARPGATVAYRTYEPRREREDRRLSSSLAAIAHKSSDGLNLVADPFDGSVHVVSEKGGGQGIFYNHNRGGAFGESLLFAESELRGIRDPDDCQPDVAIDSARNAHVVFAGAGEKAYVVVVDRHRAYSAPLSLTAKKGNGRKYTNPSVVASTERVGAYVAYQGDGKVWLRAIGAAGDPGAARGRSAAAGAAGRDGILLRDDFDVYSPGSIVWQGGWAMSKDAPQDAPHHAQVASPGLGGTRGALLLAATGQGTSRSLARPVGEETVVVEFDFLPASLNKPLTFALREGPAGDGQRGRASAFVRLNRGRFLHLVESNRFEMEEFAGVSFEAGRRLHVRAFVDYVARTTRLEVDGVLSPTVVTRWKYGERTPRPGNIDILCVLCDGGSRLDNLVVTAIPSAEPFARRVDAVPAPSGVF